MNKYLIGIILILLCFITLLNKQNRRLDIERDILKSNQNALINRANYYRTKDSLSVSSIERLTLSNNQLKESYKQLDSRCCELNIKLQDINSLSTTSTKSDIELNLRLRDTLIIRDSTIKSKTFHWKDSWNMVEGIIYDNRVECSIATCDTLIQIVHRVPKRLLFLRIGTKAIRQEVISSNPYNSIVYNEYITLKNI